jgi:hypothetical protein
MVENHGFANLILIYFFISLKKSDIKMSKNNNDFKIYFLDVFKILSSTFLKHKK